VRGLLVGLDNVGRDPAQNPESLGWETLPTFGRPHETALLTAFTLEAQPPVLVAHSDMRSRPEWSHAPVTPRATLASHVRAIARAARPPIDLPSFVRSGTDKPHVPSCSIRIHKISKAHSLTPTSLSPSATLHFSHICGGK